jgi:hypothetical protein
VYSQQFVVPQQFNSCHGGLQFNAGNSCQALFR